MSMTKSPENQDTSLGRDLLYAARYYLGGRRGLIALAAIALVAGLALNWGWLVAAGIAPLLLGVLPCVAMCALGLCMNKMVGRSCSTDAGAEKTVEVDTARDAHTPAALVQRQAVTLEGPAKERESDPIPVSSKQAEPVEERSKEDA